MTPGRCTLSGKRDSPVVDPFGLGREGVRGGREGGCIIGDVMFLLFFHVSGGWNLMTCL